MRFKESISIQQRSLYENRAHLMLKHVVRVIDNYSYLLREVYGESIGEPDVVITSFWREAKPSKKSFHPKFQAVDIRTKGRSAKWIGSMKKMLRILKDDDSRIQFEHEQVGLRNDHIHIEYDTGDPE